MKSIVLLAIVALGCSFTLGACKSKKCCAKKAACVSVCK